MIAPAGSETGADRQPEAAPWDGSRRLWSLWDMLRFYAEKLVVVDRYLTQLSIATHDPNIRQFDPSTLSLFKEKFAELSQTLEELGLPISKEICDELAVKLSAEPAPVPADLGGFVGRLFDIVRREIKSVYFIALSISERGFFDPSTPLWEVDFEAKFPTQGAFELEEAAKCTAWADQLQVVFHLMRIMEIGIHSVAKCLNIPDTTKPRERNWGTILEKIEKKISSRSSGSPPWTFPDDSNI